MPNHQLPGHSLLALCAGALLWVAPSEARAEGCEDWEPAEGCNLFYPWINVFGLPPDGLWVAPDGTPINGSGEVMVDLGINGCLRDGAEDPVARVEVSSASGDFAALLERQLPPSAVFCEAGGDFDVEGLVASFDIARPELIAFAKRDLVEGYEAEYYWDFYVTVDPVDLGGPGSWDGIHEENGPTDTGPTLEEVYDNFESTSVFRPLVPLSNEVYFGSQRLTHTFALSGVNYDTPDCADGLWVESGTVNFDPDGAGSTWQPVTLQVVGDNTTTLGLNSLCLRPDFSRVTAAGVPLRVMNAVNFPARVGGVIDGFPVEVDFVLTQSGEGVTPTAGELTLPTGVAWHARAREVPPNWGNGYRGFDSPRGLTRFPLSFLSTVDGAPARFDNLTASPDPGASYYLTAETLPFAVGVDRIEFDLRAVAGHRVKLGGPASLHWLRDPQWPSLSGRYGPLDRSRNRVFGPDNKPLTNDVMFSAANPGCVFLSSEGLFASTGFAAGRGESHYPRATLEWTDLPAPVDGQGYCSRDHFTAQPDGFDVQASRLVARPRDPDEQGRIAMRLDQSRECAGCGTSVGDVVPQRLPPQGDDPVVYAISSAGTLTFSGSFVGPVEWGPQRSLGPSTSPRTFSYDLSVHRAHAVIPGFMAPGGVSPTDFLAASFDADGLPQVAGSDAWRRGNGFFPGITLGPETYRNDLGQPVAGGGEPLTTRVMEVAFGGPKATPTVTNLQTSAGAKLVLKPSGVTGVFNFQQTPTINVYGFPLSLTRFAFAMVDNKGQAGSWIDGQLDLPSWAGFAVPFSSLELQCTGHLGGGLVDQGRLAGLPANKKRLAGWRAPYTIGQVAFAPVPPADQCSAGDRVLETGGALTVKALTQAIDLTSYWAPSGAPAASPPPRLSGQGLVEFARPTTGGETGFFLDAKADQVALARTPEATFDATQSRGWFELGGALRLPFWKSPAVVVRLQNKLDGEQAVAERTLVRRPGAVSSTLWQKGNDDPALGSAVTAALPPSDGMQQLAWADARINTPFPWVFDIDFPMRWSPDEQGRPRFIPGSNQADPGADLGILKVQAAATRTTPRETEIKFGASADLNVAAAISIPTQIDIFSQESVGKVDEVLRDITGNGSMKCPDQQNEPGPSGPLWCVVKYIKQPSQFIAKTVGPMFSGFVQAQVSTLIDEVLGGVLDDLANLVSTIQSAPMALVNAGLAEVTRLVDEGLAQLSGPLSTEVKNLYFGVSQSLADAVTGLDNASGSVSLSGGFTPQIREALFGACALLDPSGQCNLDPGVTLACGFTPTPAPISLGKALGTLKDATATVDDAISKTSSAITQQVGNINKAIFGAECLVSGFRWLLRASADTSSYLPWVSASSGCAANPMLAELKPAFNLIDDAAKVRDLFLCTNGQPSGNELFTKVNQIADAIDKVLAAVERDEIPTLVQGVGSFVGADLTTFTQALKEIGAYARSIRARLNSARSSINAGFCKVGAGIEELVAPVRDLLVKLEGPLKKVSGVANFLADKAKNVETGLKGLQTGVLAKIGQAANFASELQTQVGTPIKTLLTLDNQLCAGLTIDLDKQYRAGLPRTASEFRVLMNKAADAVGEAIGLKGLTLVDPITKTTVVDRLVSEVKAPVYGIIANVQNEIGSLFSDLVKQIPFPTRAEMRQWLVSLVTNSSFVRDLDKLIEQNIRLILEEVDKVAARLVEQLNGFVRKALELVNAKLRELLEGVTSAISGAVGFSGAALDGYAKIVGNAIQLLQIDARFDSKPSKGSGDEEKRKDEDQSFRASLVMKSWALSDKGKNCDIPESQAEGMLDASIGVHNVPFTFGGEGGLKIQELSFGFTLDGTKPVGFNGALITTGMLDFKAFSIRDIRFLAGFGELENYVGASAAANFSGYDMSVAFLVGKTCDPTILTTLDPQFAGFVKIPEPGAFDGGYVRGSASIPVFNFGCFFKVGFGADFGAWFLNRAVGGLIGGSVFGQIACLVSVRGTVRMAMTYNTDNGSVFFKGQGWCAAGIGACSPDKWLTVEDSRKDGVFCFTMDALMDAEYEDAKGFDMKKLDVTGPH